MTQSFARKLVVELFCLTPLRDPLHFVERVKELMRNKDFLAPPKKT